MAEVLGKITFSETPDVNGLNVLLNGGGVASIASDTTANFPSPGTVGRIFLDTTINRFYRDNGTLWDDLTPLPLIDGTANQIVVTDGTNVTPSIVSLADDVTLPGTEGFVPPSGTTAQRAGAPVAGSTRFNSTLNKLETFNGTYWSSSNTVLQVVTGDIASGSGTTTIPLDSTTPTITEGWQIWSASFTPISATSKILIQFDITSSHSAATGTNILCLFAGNTNIAAVAGRTDSVANTATELSISKSYSPGSTAAITFSARLGNPTSGTSYCNRIGSNTLGGVLVSSYIITEVQ